MVIWLRRSFEFQPHYLKENSQILQYSEAVQQGIYKCSVMRTADHFCAALRPVEQSVLLCVKPTIVFSFASSRPFCSSMRPTDHFVLV